MRHAWLALVALLVAGCSSIDGLLHDIDPPMVRFEVWNRTLDDATLTDADGTRLPVEACDHAVAVRFRVDRVRVHTTVGYVWGFGSGGVDAGSGRQFLVIVPGDGESFPAGSEPMVIPPCRGHLRSQPGVFLAP